MLSVVVDTKHYVKGPMPVFIFTEIMGRLLTVHVH